jgi:hypothetical protein
MSEAERVAIIDKQGSNKVADVVESVDFPGVFGVVLLKPDGSNIG